VQGAQVWSCGPTSSAPPKGTVRQGRAFATPEGWGHRTRRPTRPCCLEPLSPAYRPLPAFAAATGLRPEEWQALERRDLDRAGGIVHVRRTVSSGEVVDLAKTRASRRQVPLSPRALAAVDGLSPRLDTPLLFPAPRGGLMDLNHFRRREWAPAIDAAGIARPARIYDLRSTFASNALAAGVAEFELARVLGTSGAMIERHYGKLIEGAGADIARRLGAFEADHGCDEGMLSVPGT
jgi:integrase